MHNESSTGQLLSRGKADVDYLTEHLRGASILKKHAVEK